MQTLSAWTRLEAIAKARGSGIGAVLEAIGIHDPGASEASAATAARRLIDSGEALTISDLAVARFDAVAALARSRGAAAPTLRELSGSLSSRVR
jgi:phosphopantetheinyl transferase